MVILNHTHAEACRMDCTNTTLNPKSNISHWMHGSKIETTKTCVESLKRYDREKNNLRYNTAQKEYSVLTNWLYRHKRQLIVFFFVCKIVTNMRDYRRMRLVRFSKINNNQKICIC